MQSKPRLEAIAQTDITLSVPARVAAGLESVALYVTFTAIVEWCIVVFIFKTVQIGVIQQLVTFSGIVLTVDYFMESESIPSIAWDSRVRSAYQTLLNSVTFFVTVLSIDMQRLEVRLSQFRLSLKAAAILTLTVATG